MQVSYLDNPAYLENQWVEDTYKAFEQEHGEEGETLQNLAGMLVHLSRSCDADGPQLNEALQIAARRFSEETRARGQEF